VAMAPAISPDYFRAMGIQMLTGREFSDRDGSDSDRVIIINETMAKSYWPNENPIGRRLKPFNSEQPWARVVGVVGDVRQVRMDKSPKPEMYIPIAQYSSSPDWSMVVHTASDPLKLVTAIREAVWAVDKDQPVSHIRTMEQVTSGSLVGQRFNLVLLGSFAGLALALSSAGIYGVMSYTVAQRTREIGIRMALGANSHNVLGLIVGGGLKLVVIGVAIGLVAALAVTRLMASLLFGVSAIDPPTFVTVSIVLICVALLAAYVPARRATRIDPIVALRSQ
jgi:putative ABC transport system permease protein